MRFFSEWPQGADDNIFVLLGSRIVRLTVNKWGPGGGLTRLRALIWAGTRLPSGNFVPFWHGATEQLRISGRLRRCRAQRRRWCADRSIIGVVLQRGGRCTGAAKLLLIESGTGAGYGRDS